MHFPAAPLVALWTLRDACLLFLADPTVPFTNNRAEQALRMAPSAEHKHHPARDNSRPSDAMRSS